MFRRLNDYINEHVGIEARFANLSLNQIHFAT
jgi:hypothetical protein